MRATRVRIGVLSGYATASSCQMVVCSLFPSAVTVTISLGGVQPGITYVNTLTAFGGDRPSAVTLNAELSADIGATTIIAGFVKAFTVAGLPSRLARYTWVASQVQNGVTYTETGSFMTAPAAGDDFKLLFGSCDNVKLGYGAGAWAYVQSAITTSAIPIAAMLWTDDFGYVDFSAPDDRFNGGTGHLTYGLRTQTNGKQYDYALAYMCNLGMLENTDNANVASGRENLRIWGLQNINLLPQFGDHEFIDDIGFDASTADAVSIPPLSGVSWNACYLAGRAVWNTLLKPLQPVFTGVDTAANHWACQYGSVNIIAPDYITNGDGTGTSAFNTAVTTILGSNQINDILNWRDSNANTFNIFAMGFGIRYTTGSPSTYHEFQSGSQHPMANHCVAEYEQLFTKTGNTPKSIMDSPYSNGKQGVSICCHGDYHRATVCKQVAAGDGTHATECFYTIHNGTFNGYANFTETYPLAVGDTYDGKVTKIADAGWAASGGHYALTTLTVYGSYPVKELHAQIYTSNIGELWHGRWLERLGNSGFPTTWEAPSVFGRGSL